MRRPLRPAPLLSFFLMAVSPPSSATRSSDRARSTATPIFNNARDTAPAAAEDTGGGAGSFQSLALTHSTSLRAGSGRGRHEQRECRVRARFFLSFRLSVQFSHALTRSILHFVQDDDHHPSFSARHAENDGMGGKENPPALVSSSTPAGAKALACTPSCILPHK
jgi:hypothetical protein